MTQEAQKIDVSVVIVNYRVKFFLEQTIRSVKEALTGLIGEIIVIDNNSGDDSIPHLRKCFPEIIIIENNNNAGFGRANNQGFAIAKGEFTLILNPDTIITARTIHDCIQFYRSTPLCGAIGVMMHDGNGRFLPESKRSFPTPWVSFCKMFGLSALMPKSPLFARYHLRFLPNDKTHSVDILSGAMMFIKTDLLQSLGGFDEDFFMYGEDIDLSYRIVRAGRKNYYLPTPIIHYKGESTKKNTMRYVEIFYEAMLIFFRKHYPHYSKVFACAVRLAIRFRALIAICRRLIGRITPPRKSSPESYDNLFIISSRPQEIIPQVTVAYRNLVTLTDPDAIKFSNAQSAMTIVDNRDCSYLQTVRLCCRGVGKDHDFATYLSQSKIIITPKNNQ